jgi:hypothetical protein
VEIRQVGDEAVCELSGPEAVQVAQEFEGLGALALTPRVGEVAWQIIC